MQTTKTTRTKKTTTTNSALAAKAARLRGILADYESVLVAFSGGVDSAYLAIAANAALGPRALAVTADSPSYPDTHRQLALSIAREFSLAHEVVHTSELDRPEYRANPANRCYFCKDELYGRLSEVARERGLAVIVDGNNADDRGDYRPGRQAAREHGVKSPLDEADLIQGRHPGAVAPGRARQLGRTGVGVPVVAHSVWPRGHRQRAAADRTRRAGDAGTGLPRLPRAPPRHAWPGSRSPAARWPARSIRRSTRSSCRPSKRSAISM